MSVKLKGFKNGPIAVEVDGEVKYYLCRCGMSNNKPYCDGSHEPEFEADEFEIDTE